MQVDMSVTAKSTGSSSRLAIKLEVGRKYTAQQIILYGFHTDVYLKEHPGIPFNSTWFEEDEQIVSLARANYFSLLRSTPLS